MKVHISGEGYNNLEGWRNLSITIDTSSGQKIESCKVGLFKVFVQLP